MFQVSQLREAGDSHLVGRVHETVLQDKGSVDSKLRNKADGDRDKKLSRSFYVFEN